MKKLIYLLIGSLLISSCSNTLLITQGEQGFSGEIDEKYEIKELNSVYSSSTSFFGLSNYDENKNGIITNYFSNGVNSQNNFIRVITLFSYSSILPIVTASAGPTSPLIIIGGILFGGILNNATWIRTSEINSMKKANLKLIEENPNIDLFIYPKFKIQSKKGVFSNSSNVTIHSKGAIIKTK